MLNLQPYVFVCHFSLKHYHYRISCFLRSAAVLPSFYSGTQPKGMDSVLLTQNTQQITVIDQIQILVRRTDWNEKLDQ